MLPDTVMCFGSGTNGVVTIHHDERERQKSKPVQTRQKSSKDFVRYKEELSLGRTVVEKGKGKYG